VCWEKCAHYFIAIARPLPGHSCMPDDEHAGQKRVRVLYTAAGEMTAIRRKNSARRGRGGDGDGNDGQVTVNGAFSGQATGSVKNGKPRAAPHRVTARGPKARPAKNGFP
jgi:hypothetical protein